MKSIHAISTIFAVRGMGSSAWTPANRSLHPAEAMRLAEQRIDGVRETADRPSPRQLALGIPNLLAAALLQGGSRTDRRYR